ncbi:MAG TPA: NERD domain-containing protein, partial [Thermomicrobiales bacterium]|nr:NERD domain-containing protein [Thermomicrobiales bacterium]
MARMYPAQVSSATTSGAERTLFNQLRLQLPDHWIAMHSVGWLNRNPRRDEHGEADFLIVHPDRGVLVLEVKGGHISGKWADDTWFSVDARGRKHEIKNPVKQANRSMWALKTKLASSPGTGRFTYPLAHGVAFPDMLVEDATFGIDFDRALAIDSSNMANLLDTFERMMPVRSNGQRPSKSAIEALVALIQPVVEIRRPGLVAQVLEDESEIVRLTEQQAAMLSFIQRHPQAVINGCAGSGKTMLAMEKAIQLASDGFDVLLTCYNRNLAAWMASVIDTQPANVGPRIRVSHYHDLAFQLCKEAGVPSVVQEGNPGYWNDVLPNQLLAAIPVIETRFDAIVVDEGQDFEDGWWLTLLELLRDPDRGVFYIFQDERQDIYQR